MNAVAHLPRRTEAHRPVPESPGRGLVIYTAVMLAIAVGCVAVLTVWRVQDAATTSHLDCVVSGLAAQLDQQAGERIGAYPARPRC